MGKVFSFKVFHFISRCSHLVLVTIKVKVLLISLAILPLVGSSI